LSITKTNAIIAGVIGSQGVIIPGPNKRKTRYDNTIPDAQRRRLDNVLFYEGPTTPAHILKKEVRLNLTITAKTIHKIN
jgi:hypothetical protein